MLCYLFIERLFCLPDVQICAVLTVLNSINYITLFMPGCFILRVEMFLPRPVGRFEMNWDMMLVKILLSLVVLSVTDRRS